MGSVRAACRLLGVHHSTYYRWRRQLVRFGPELLRPRERRQPRMPNAIPPMVEQRILALALAQPGWGPDRLSLELGREKWGGLKVSGNGVWRVLKRHGLNTRAKRLSLVCGYAAPPLPQRPEPPPERHIEAKHPGHRVQFDNFDIGRLAGTEGVVLGDEEAAAAVIDRLLHYSTPENSRGDSYRHKDKKQPASAPPL